MALLGVIEYSTLHTYFTFVDLYCTLWQKWLVPAMDFLKSYLRTVHPLVVGAYSQEVKFSDEIEFSGFYRLCIRYLSPSQAQIQFNTTA